MITKEHFLNSEIAQISSVYSGMRDCCRCGCKGDYTTTTFATHERSDANNVLVEKRLKRAKKLIIEGAEFDAGDNYFDVKTAENRSLTFYFDEVKKTENQ